MRRDGPPPPSESHVIKQELPFAHPPHSFNGICFISALTKQKTEFTMDDKQEHFVHGHQIDVTEMVI